MRPIPGDAWQLAGALGRLGPEPGDLAWARGHERIGPGVQRPGPEVLHDRV
jgi:hypothetical protein